MTVLKLTYGGDMIAIFPPDDGEGEFHVVTAYDGKVQQYGKRDVEGSRTGSMPYLLKIRPTMYTRMKLRKYIIK